MSLRFILTPGFSSNFRLLSYSLEISYLGSCSKTVPAASRRKNELRPNNSQILSNIYGQRVDTSCMSQYRTPKTLACSKSLCFPFQVQTKKWSCNRQRITCNCGVVIRDHNDLISFSCCGNPPKVYRDDFTPISVDIPRKKCLAPGITITHLIKGVNSKYEVFPCCLILILMLHYVQLKGLWKCVCVYVHAVVPCKTSVLFADWICPQRALPI